MVLYRTGDSHTLGMGSRPKTPPGEGQWRWSEASVELINYWAPRDKHKVKDQVDIGAKYTLTHANP